MLLPYFTQMNQVITMITVTLVRHAESEANVSTKDIIGGHNLQARLTPRGENQAAAAGNYFKRKGVKFTAAYCSTALRTQMTAKICFETMGCELPVIPDDQLLEQSAGDWEGQSRMIYQRADVRQALDTDNWNYIPGDDVPGESQQMVADRMRSWIEKKVAACDPADGDHHIVVFTHGLAIKFLLAVLLDLDRPTAYTHVNAIENASITQLRFQERKVILPLEKRNHTKHLSEVGFLKEGPKTVVNK